MYSKTNYSFEPRGSQTREDGNSRWTGNATGARYITHMAITPKEGKTEREKFSTREDSRCVSENVTKSVVRRSVVDKRSSSSYKTREDKTVTRRDLKGSLNSDGGLSKFPSADLLYLNQGSKETPIASFYSSRSNDELSGEATRKGSGGEDMVSSFYRSGNDTKMSDQTSGEESGDYASKLSNQEVSSYGLRETNRENRCLTNDEGVLDTHERRGSIEKQAGKLEALSQRANDEAKVMGLDDTNIRRRSLERKQASNSLERERLSKRFSVDDRSDSSKYVPKIYVSFSDVWGNKEPRPSYSSKGVSFHRDEHASTRYGCDDDKVDYKRRDEFGGKTISRSFSLESLDDSERKSLGIYRELPGREEFLSHRARRKSNEEGELSRPGRRQDSLERDVQGSDHERRDPVLRLRSKSSSELRDSEKSNFMSGYRSTDQLSKGTSKEELRAMEEYSTRKSAYDQLVQDRARLKPEAVVPERMPKTEAISLYSDSKRTSSHDKLKEDIAKLKVETLTREHIKPYILPTPSRGGLEDHTSRTRNPPVSTSQEKLKDKIAKIKTETRDFPTPLRYGLSTGPDEEDKQRSDIPQSGVTTSSFERYSYSNTDGSVIKDEMRRSESQRYGNPESLKHIKEDEDKSACVDRHRDEKLVKGYIPGSSLDYAHPTSGYGDLSSRRFTETEDQLGPIARKQKDDWSSIEKIDGAEWGSSWINRRRPEEEPLGFPRGIRRGSSEGYGTKQVIRTDSTMSMTSTKNGDHGPSSVTGFFHGSVSREDQSAYYRRKMDDQENMYRREPSRKYDAPRPSESFQEQQPSKEKANERSEEVPTKPTNAHFTRGSYQEPHLPRPHESATQKEPIPLVHRELDKKAKNHEDLPVPSPTYSKDDHTHIISTKRGETSDRVQKSQKFITRNTFREDSVISRRSSTEDVKDRTSTKDTTRRVSERSEDRNLPADDRRASERSDNVPRRTSMRQEILNQSSVSSPNKIVEERQEFSESRPSAMAKLRKKIEQLKSKVDALDDSKSRGKLEKYVDEHSDKKPDVDIKGPVHIPRYQPTAGIPERDFEVDGAEPKQRTATMESTSQTINQQVSRQTSTASTTHRVSNIREEDLSKAPRKAFASKEFLEEASHTDEGIPREEVVVEMRDAQTMTTPDIEEQVGRDKYLRLNSLVSDIVEEPGEIGELRGVPIEAKTVGPQIQEIIDTDDEKVSGFTTIQIDTQQPLSPRKCWWNAFTAEDVDRLLDIGSPVQWNPYTAEDMDQLWQLGPAKRRSLGRGSYGRSSLQRKPHFSQDELVDVFVRVRGRQDKPNRAQCIISAQAAPQEKAIVLRRDAKETADPFIRKIKVDDVYGAEAVKVENGIVKIKVGDLSSKGRKAWARILQRKDRIVESDGTVTIPVSQDQYTDGVCYTSYNEKEGQDGGLRIPVKFQDDELDRSQKIRVVGEIKRAGATRRRMRTADTRAYIVGARYYDGKILMSNGSYGSQVEQNGIVMRGRRHNPRVVGNAIVLRGNQPYTVPMKTVQRIHAGHKLTRQAASVKEKDGKTVITVHAIPSQPPRFNLKQIGNAMTQGSGKLISSPHNDYNLGTSRTYFVNSGTNRQRTPYIVNEPSNSYRSSSLGVNGSTVFNSSDEVSKNQIIVPYEGKIIPNNSQTKSYNRPLIADSSSFHAAPSSKIKIHDPRLNARTAYGETFTVQDYGAMSKMQYVNEASGKKTTNDRQWENGRYKYGRAWDNKQHEKINGRRISWAVEEVTPEF